MVTILIHQSGSEELGDMLMEHVFSKHSLPECLIMDQDSAFMSTLINHLFMKLGIKTKTNASYYQSPKTEHRIKPLATIPKRHLILLLHMAS